MIDIESTTSSMSELTSRKQWVCWKQGETKLNGRFSKIPCNPGHPFYSIKVQDPDYHRSYEDALKAAKSFVEIAGIGFVPKKEDPFCFLDLDKCIDLETDWCADWAAKIIEELDSFTYLTPSRKGIRIVLRGELAHEGGNYLYRYEQGSHPLEVYDSNRFLTFTHRIVDKPIREAQEWLNGLTKISATSPRNDLNSEHSLSEIGLDEDLDKIRREVKETLVAHELNPEPIREGLRKSTLISIGAKLLAKGKTEEWWEEFLPKLNETLLYNDNGELEGLDKTELDEIISVNFQLDPKASPKEVQQHLDSVSEFLKLIRPRMKGAYNTDWNFLKALEIQGRKYGSIVSDKEVRIDGSWLTLQGLSRIATPKTLSSKISRLTEGGILERGKGNQDRSGYFVLDVQKFLSGEYFNLSESEIKSMREDSNVMCVGYIHNNHCFTILTHTFWTRQYGNARGPLFSTIASLGGKAKTGEIARKMGRLDSDGKPNSSSISGLLRQCESEGTLENPHWGYWQFSEDFADSLYRAKADAGEFERDSTFTKHKEDKREKHKQTLREHLEGKNDERGLFNEILKELEKENPKLAMVLRIGGASKPMLILDKYWVDGYKVKGIMGGDPKGV